MVVSNGTFTTTDPQCDVDIRMGAGAAARAPVTVGDALRRTAKAVPEKVALRVKREGVWREWTWSQYAGEAVRVAQSLIALGVKEREAVAIIGFNSPEWVFTWAGAATIGCMGTGIYATNGPEGVAYVVDHAKAKIIIAEDEKQLAKFRKVDSSLLKSVKAFVVYSPNEPTPDKVHGIPAYTWAGFMELGSQTSQEAVEVKRGAVVPGQCCSLIYTSGTTGNPKAVMISHDSCTWTAKVAFEDVFGLGREEHVVSYLPLSHIAAQLMDIISPMVNEVTVHFARPDALKGSLKGTLQECQPTVFFGVPRVWEKFREAILAKAKDLYSGLLGGIKKNIGATGNAYNLSKYLAAERGEAPPGGCLSPALGRKVSGGIKAVLGFERCHTFCTGAAPIARDILEYFGSHDPCMNQTLAARRHAIDATPARRRSREPDSLVDSRAGLDINVLELFGMSEVTGPSNCSVADAFRIGKCGRQLPGTETAIAQEDGEVIFRGRHVMMGYMYNDKATKETIDDQGWLHSGDIGTNDEGYLKITGRKKEILITAAGENVAPVLLEDEIKKQLPCVSNAMVIGDRRKYLTVFLCLKTKMNEEDGTPLDGLVSDSALFGCNTVQDAKRSSEYKAHLDAGLTRANKNAISRAQNVQKWAILPRDFTQEGGELTPTMKLRRKVVLEMYPDVVAQLY